MERWLNIYALATICAACIGLVDSSPAADSCGQYRLKPMYEWSVMMFDTPPSFRPHPSYQPNSTYVSSIDEAGGLLYLATPRDFDILPATLSTIPASLSLAKTSSPKLKPYPDINWHRTPGNASDCDSTLVSARAVKRDDCNRLWVLDSGVIFDETNAYHRICLPKIVIFHLSTNRAERVISIPDEVVKPLSVLANLVLDPAVERLSPSSVSCDNTFVYLADTDMAGLIVLTPRGRFYRVSSPCMRPDPRHASVEMNGEIFACYFGIYGMDVSEEGESRSLYLQPVSSTNVFSIPTSFLRSGPFTGDLCQVPVTEKFSKQSGGFALRTDPVNGCLLFNTMSQNSVNSWSPAQQVQRTVVRNSSYLTAVYDIARDSSNKNQKYALTVNLPRYIKGNVDTRAINIRILSLKNTH